MADIKSKFGALTALAFTVNSLTNTSLRECTAIDNSGLNFLDAIIQYKLQTGATASGTINFYAYFKLTGGGSGYTGNASGIDAAYTGDKNQLRFLDSLSVTAINTLYRGGLILSDAFKYGVIPPSVGIIVENLSGGTLDTTASNFLFEYQGITAQQI